jgi:hypothetical protein
VDSIESSYRWGRCKICRRDDKAKIEAIALSGKSLRTAAVEASNACGMNLSASDIRYHMTTHVDPEKINKMKAYIEISKLSLRDGEDLDDVSVPPEKLIVGVLLWETVGKVMDGTIKINSLGDALRVVQASDWLRQSEHKIDMDERKMEIEQGASVSNIEDSYRQLGYIMQAFKAAAKTPEEMKFLQTVIMKAWELGLGEDITDMAQIPIYRAGVEEWSETDMSAAVRGELTEGTTQEEPEDEDVPPDE